MEETKTTKTKIAANFSLGDLLRIEEVQAGVGVIFACTKIVK